MVRTDGRSTSNRRSMGPRTDDFVVPGREPTPDDAVALADEVEWVLSRLDPFGRRVMELRMQGAQLSEIAEDTGRSERSVRRTLGQIRELLARRLDDA